MPETVKRKRTTRPPAVTTHKEIRAESFVLVDETGRERAYLSARKDETVLAMYDPRGGLRLAIHASERETVLNIFDKYAGADKDRRGDTIELIRLGYEASTHDERLPGLHIFDTDENDRLELRVDDRGGLALITAPNGQYASLDGDGLAIYDENNKALANYERSAVKSSDQIQAEQSVLTFEQARDKVTAAVCELIEHPDTSPGVATWVGEFTEVLLRKMDAQDAPTHAAEQTATKPPSTWLTAAEAEDIIAPLLDTDGSAENDELARVLYKLIQLFAYEEDQGKRDADANMLAEMMYRHTADCAYAGERFAAQVGCYFGAPPLSGEARPA